MTDRPAGPTSTNGLQRTQTISVELGGLSASVTGADGPFMEYAQAHLAPLRTPGSGPPRVHATLRWLEGAPPADRLAAYAPLRQMERVDRDLYRGDGRLAWFRVDELPDLHLRFAWNGERLEVEADYYYRLSKDPRRDQIKRLLFRRRLPQLRRRRFTTLLYYLLYYPCFWLLERQRDFHPIHAAGIEIDGSVVVRAGPSGVGKSTLAVGLSASPGARLLSDTFLLHRGTAVFSVPEPLLLDEWSRAWLGDGAALLQRIPHRYCNDRDGFHFADARRCTHGEIKLLLFPCRAGAHFVRPMAPAQAQGRLRAGDLIVNDLRRYWAFAAVMELLDSTPLVQSREDSLAALVAQVPTYEMGLTKDVTREELLALIRKLLTSAGDAATTGRAATVA